MTIFIAGLILFFGSHLYSVFRSREDGKNIVAKMGYAAYMGLYSLLSLSGLVLLIYGYVQLRPSPIIYSPPDWGRHVNYVLMIPALIFFISSQLPAGYIKARLKHPMLVSLKIWALGHLLANGELNSVILFATFLAFAVIDRIAVKNRPTKAKPAPNPKWDIAAIVLGLALYAGIFFVAHEWLFGVPVYV